MHVFLKCEKGRTREVMLGGHDKHKKVKGRVTKQNSKAAYSATEISTYF